MTINSFFKKVNTAFTTLFFNPFEMFLKWYSLPSYLLNLFKYLTQQKDTAFKISLPNMLFLTSDKYKSAGSASGSYLLQDLWAAQKIYASKVSKHYDIGSRIDGFITHLLVFCEVEYLDIRKLESNISNFKSIEGNILNLPYTDNSITSLSCLHVIEHIGLGRFGDPVNAKGHDISAEEITRVLAPGGRFYLGTPVGRERLVFDAHRIFDPDTILKMFSKLKLVEFNLIDDNGDKIIYNADLSRAKSCRHGFGLFIFSK